MSFDKRKFGIIIHSDEYRGEFYYEFFCDKYFDEFRRDPESTLEMFVYYIFEGAICHSYKNYESCLNSDEGYYSTFGHSVLI